MATSWTIEIGYMSGATTHHNRDEAWELLKTWATRLIDDPEQFHRIAQESVDFTFPLKIDGEPTIAFFEVYQKAWEEGGPLRFDDTVKRIAIGASGGGASRQYKEIIARAFCLEMYRRMTRYGVDLRIGCY